MRPLQPSPCACLVIASALAIPRLVPACQSPPVIVDADAHVSFDLSCMTANEPVTLWVTLTNMGSHSSPYADNELFSIEVAALSASALLDDPPEAVDSADDDGDFTPNALDVCPTTHDFLQLDEDVPTGELRAVHSAGAYGFAMSSNYNGRCRAAEVLVKGDRFEVVRARDRFEDLIRGESIPEDLIR